MGDEVTKSWDFLVVNSVSGGKHRTDDRLIGVNVIFLILIFSKFSGDILNIVSKAPPKFWLYKWGISSNACWCSKLARPLKKSVLHQDMQNVMGNEQHTDKCKPCFVIDCSKIESQNVTFPVLKLVTF